MRPRTPVLKTDLSVSVRGALVSHTCHCCRHRRTVGWNSRPPIHEGRALTAALPERFSVEMKRYYEFKYSYEIQIPFNLLGKRLPNDEIFFTRNASST